MFAKKSAYVKICYIGIKWMYFFIEDGKLFEKYDSIWNKVSNNTKKRNFVFL